MEEELFKVNRTSCDDQVPTQLAEQLSGSHYSISWANYTQGSSDKLLAERQSEFVLILHQNDRALKSAKASE